MPSQSRLATLYYKREITTTDSTDITGDVVKFAFVARGTVPSTGDFVTATYVADNVWKILVGPSGATVNLSTAGTYDVWMKVTDTPEVEAELVDVLEIT